MKKPLQKTLNKSAASRTILSGHLAAIAFGAMFLGLGQPASATAIVDSTDPTKVTVFEVGDMFDVNYLCETGDLCPDDDTGSPPFDLSAQTWWTVTEFSTGGTNPTVKFEIQIENTTDGDSKLTDFGVNVLDPEASGANVTTDFSGTADNFSTLNWASATGVTFPGFMTVDLCIFAEGPGGSCPGGGAGLESGEKDKLELTLTFASGADFSNGLMLQGFPIQFQSVGEADGSFQFAGLPEAKNGDNGDGDNGEFPGGEIPEPGILSLLGIGLLGFGFARRRRHT